MRVAASTFRAGLISCASGRPSRSLQARSTLGTSPGAPQPGAPAAVASLRAAELLSYRADRRHSERCCPMLRHLWTARSGTSVNKCPVFPRSSMGQLFESPGNAGGPPQYRRQSGGGFHQLGQPWAIARTPGLMVSGGELDGTLTSSVVCGQSSVLCRRRSANS